MRRKVLGPIILITVLGITSYCVSEYLRWKDEERVKILSEHEDRIRKESIRTAEAEKSIWKRMNRADTLGDWEALQKELPSLSAEDQGAVRPVIVSKILERYFWRAERLLVRSRALLEQDERHPMAKAYLEEAGKIHEDLEKKILELRESPGNPEFNFRLYYLKGAIHYRSLTFLDLSKDKTKAEDIIIKALENWSKALVFRPKDWDTQVAIEVLQKKAGSILSGSGGEEVKLRMQLMPSRDKEILGPFAIGGRKEGRH